MMTLKLICGCGRHLLAVTPDDRTCHTVTVTVLPGATDRIDASTHHVACGRCGQNWPLPEWKLRGWVRVRLFTTGKLLGGPAPVFRRGVLRVRLTDLQ
jgi:hypothetical protein